MSTWEFDAKITLINGKVVTDSKRVEADIFEEAMDRLDDHPEDVLTEPEKAMVTRVQFDCRMVS